MAIHWKAYHLNRMIQDALRQPALMGRLMMEPEALFDEYKMTESEKTVFREPNPERLQSIGVHPILAMVYMIPRDDQARKRLTIDPAFLNDLMESR